MPAYAVLIRRTATLARTIYVQAPHHSAIAQVDPRVLVHDSDPWVAEEDDLIEIDAHLPVGVSELATPDACLVLHKGRLIHKKRLEELRELIESYSHLCLDNPEEREQLLDALLKGME